MATNKTKHAVISCSGGLDSTCLLMQLIADGYQVHVLQFDYGSKQNKTEYRTFQKVLDILSDKEIKIDYHHCDLSNIMGKFYSSLTRSDIDSPDGHYADENMKVTVVPNRNAVFASIIYGYALSIAKAENCDVVISMGVHGGDHTIYPDCRPEFVDSLYKSFAMGNWDSEKVTLNFPFLNMSKAGVLASGVKSCEELGIAWERIMGNTITCYKPDSDGRSCGKCGSCTERLEAFAINNLKDVISYAK